MAADRQAGDQAGVYRCGRDIHRLSGPGRIRGTHQVQGLDHAQGSVGRVHAVDREGGAPLQARSRAFLGTVDILIHGTTLATNTLITGRGAKTAMLTTKNFRDILEIRRGIKPVDISLYNIFIPPNRPLVPRSRRIGIEERTLYTGEITTPLNEQQVAESVKQAQQGRRRIACGLLPAFVQESAKRAPRRGDCAGSRARHVRHDFLASRSRCGGNSNASTPPSSAPTSGPP